MPTPVKRERNPALYETILRLESVEECIRFFEDLCAVTELSAIEQRFSVAQELLAGRVYSDILSSTGASSATVSRVNRMLRDGNGCLQELIERTKLTQEGND
ncbi:MAG: TrpR-like protein [Oscillospiraceae bacterium]|nr:TrpR-like protein [Oscillospiraceae bacterium]